MRNAAYSWLAKNRPSAIVLAGGAEEAEAHPGAMKRQSLRPLRSLADRVGGSSKRRDGDRALPIVFKETLVMREINGLSYRDIAEATGAPVGTVMSRLARARGLLVEKLGTVAMTRPVSRITHCLLHAALDSELDAAGIIEWSGFWPPIRTLRRNMRG